MSVVARYQGEEQEPDEREERVGEEGGVNCFILPSTWRRAHENNWGGKEKK